MFWNRLKMFSLNRWGTSAGTNFEIVWQFFRWSDEDIQLRRVLKLPYNVFVEAMRGFGWDKYWDYLRIFSLKWWGNSAQTSFEIDWQYFLWSDEEIRLGRVLKLSYNVFVEAMRKVGWDKYWDCLRILSLKRCGNSAETSFEIVWQYFRWSDEEIRLRGVLKSSYNVFVEAMREFGWNKFWNGLTIISLKRWGNSAETSFKNCLTMFSLERWMNSAETSIEIGLDYFRWSDEEIRRKQVLKLSDNIFVEVIKKSG